jgi:periplasmic copper chaperone A
VKSSLIFNNFEKGNLMKLKNYLFLWATALSATSLFCPSSSFAHVVLAEPTAAAGSYYRATFKVGHGCEGSSTTAISINIPDGFTNVKPMPKPGWVIERKMEKLSKPIESHGKKITETVRQVTWRGGPLLDQHYDEFVMMMKLPDQPGKQWLPVVQRCEKGVNEWTDIPSAGKTRNDLKMPATELNLVQATPLGEK